MKKLAPLLLCLFLISQHTHAKNWQWARAGGGVVDSPLTQGPWESWAKDMTVDKWGNTYTVGFTYDHTQFTGTNNTFPYYGGADAYIVKYDKSGNFVWAIINGADGGINFAVTCDTNGNIYVQFAGAANAQNPGHIHTSLTKDSLIYSGGSYVMKYDPNGNLIWMNPTPIWYALPQCMKIRPDGLLTGIFLFAPQGDTWESFTVAPLPANHGASLALVLLDPQTGNVIKGALLDTLPYGEDGAISVNGFSMDENNNIYLPVIGESMLGQSSYPNASFLGQVFTIPIYASVLLKIDKNFNLVKYQFDDNSTVTNSASYSDGALYTGGLEFAYSNYVTDTVGYLDNIAEYRMYKLDTGTLAPVWVSAPVICSGTSYETYVVATSKHVYMLTSYSGEIIWGGDTSALPYKQMLFDLDKATGQFTKYIIDSGSNGNTTTNMIMADAQENLLINGQFSGTFTTGPNTLTPWGGSESPIFFIEKWGVACGDTLNTADNPYPPTNLITSTGGSSSINLQWTDNSPYRISFHIYRSPNGVTGWQLADTTIGTQITLVDTGLASNTWYWYKVVAWNNAGESDPSNIDSAKTSGPIGSVTFTGPDTFCSNSLTGVYTTIAVAGNTYAWAVNGGIITSGAASNTATVTWNSTGPYKLILTECNGGSCASDSVTAIIIKPVATSTITQSICPGQSFDGYTTGGNHIDTFTSVNGCDSIRTLLLTVLSYSHSTITQSICPGQSYLGYNQTGTFTDTLHNGANGCDSIRTLVLTVLSYSHSTITQSICPGQSFLGYNQSGTFTDTLHNGSNGCDSIRTLVLTVLNTVQTTIAKGLCQGQSYDGHTATGIYVDTFNAANTCDSIRTLYLTVSANIQTSLTQTICIGDSLDGYKQTGTYTDTFIATGGCDSIRILHLTVLNNVTSTIYQTICQGQSYGGHTTTGTFIDTLQAANSCDSIRTLHLTVLPLINTTVTDSICAGHSYAGYSSTGTYVDTYLSSQGCDSIRILILTVLPVAATTVTQSICQGQDYYGYYVSGTYVDTFSAVNTCDSIRILNLTVNRVYNDTISNTICQGDTFNGHDTTGYYTDTLQTINGCDSIVTLNLTVTPSPTATISATQQVCSSQNCAVRFIGSAPPAAYYNWNFDGASIVSGSGWGPYAVKWGSAGTPVVSLAVSVGNCAVVTDSVPVTVNQAPVVTLSWDSMIMREEFFAVDGDTVYCHELNNVVPLSGGRPGGGTYTGTCIINNVFYADSALSYLHIYADTIYYTYTDSNGCTGTASNTVYLFNCLGIPRITSDNSITLYPNPATNQLFIKTEGVQPKTIIVYDVDGRQIFTQPFTPEIDINRLSSGVYFVEVAGNAGVVRKRFVKM